MDEALTFWDYRLVEMHREHGAGVGTCAQCRHLERIVRTRFRCALVGYFAGAGWRARWPACGLSEEVA